MHRMLIVGAGVTGAALATELSHRLRLPMVITIWDKARGAGGRMSTSRDSNNPDCRADFGAQYFSTTPADLQKYGFYYEDLLMNNKIRELDKNLLATTDGFRINHDLRYFSSSHGVCDVVKHLLKMASTRDSISVQVLYQKSLRSLRLNSTSSDATTWSACDEAGECSIFDSVILTIPVPQVLQLHISPDVFDNGENEAVVRRLRQVKYSSRYAVALFFKPDACGLDTFPAMKFYKDNAVMCYASSCNALRGQQSRGNSSVALLFHTATKFGAEYVDTDKDKVDKIVMDYLRQTLERSLPYDHLSSIKFHRWRYSQVEDAFEGEPGFAQLHEKPLLICAGDGFTQSSLNGCLSSATRTAEFVASRLQ